MKNYIIGIILLITHSSVWFIHGLYDDSVKLAIAETQKIASVASAKEISKIEIKNTTIQNKTIERISKEIQYKECNHSEQTYKDIKDLFK